MWLFGKKKHRVVVAAKPAKQIKKRRTKAQILADKKAEMRNEVELVRLERDLERLKHGADNEGELARFAQTAAVLKRTFGIDVAKGLGGESDDSIKGIIKELSGTPEGAAVFGAIIARIMGGLPQPAQPQPQVTVTQPVQQSQPVIEQPTPNPQLQEPQTPQPSMECRLLLALLQNTPPAEAVAQLRAQKKPEIDAFLDKLGKCNSNDDVATVFREVLSLKPDLHAAIHWLASNPPYLAAIINTLNGSNTVTAPTAPQPPADGAAGVGERKKAHGL